MSMMVFNKAAMEAAQAQTEAQLNNQISEYQTIKGALQRDLAVQKAELQAAKQELQSAQTELRNAQSALSSALSMSSSTPEAARRKAERVSAARNRVSAAQTRINNAQARITKAEQEIATLEKEIELADNAIALLQEGIAESQAEMQKIMALVVEIDGAYYISMDGAAQAIADYISYIKSMTDSIDDVLGSSSGAVGSVEVNINNIIDNMFQGMKWADRSVDFVSKILKYALANSLNISVKVADKLYVIQKGPYTIFKGAILPGLSPRYLSENLRNGKYPNATKALNSMKAQQVLKTLGRVVVVAGGVIVAGKELFFENQDQSVARRVGNAATEVGIYTAAALAGAKVGAIAGAAVGSIVPIAGTAVGAVVGAVVGVAVGVVTSLIVDNAFNLIPIGDQTLREWTKEKVGNTTEGIARGIGEAGRNVKEGIGNAVNGISNFFSNPGVLWGG